MEAEQNHAPMANTPVQACTASRLVSVPGSPRSGPTERLVDIGDPKPEDDDVVWLRSQPIIRVPDDNVKFISARKRPAPSEEEDDGRKTAPGSPNPCGCQVPENHKYYMICHKT
jgi:hypothetical protein